MRVCQSCGKEYTGKNEKYCSRKCAHREQIKNVEIKCERCGRTFLKPQYMAEKIKFCSHACSVKARPKKTRKRCPTCGRLFTPKQGSKHCSCECAMIRPVWAVEYNESERLWPYEMPNDKGVTESMMNPLG